MLTQLRPYWSEASTRDRRLFFLVVLSFCLYLSASLFVQARTVVAYEDTSDFSAYFAAATLKKEFGAGIYDMEKFMELPQAKSVTGRVRPYLYTPMLADLLAPVIPSNYTKARLLWQLFEHVTLFGLWAVCVISLLLVVKAPLVPATVIPTIVIAGFSAIERELFYGQISILMALMLFSGLLLYQFGSRYLGLLIIAVAALLKVYPIVFWVVLLLKGHFRGLLILTSMLVLIPLAWMGMFGAEDWRGFYEIQISQSWGSSEGEISSNTINYHAPNYSPTAMLTLLNDQFGWGFERSTLWKAVFGVVVVFATVLLAAMFRRIHHQFDWVALTCLGLCGIFLVSPLAWNHGFVLMVVPIACILWRAVSDANISSGVYWLALVATGLIAFPDFLTNLPMTDNGILVLLKYTKLYGLVLIACLLLFTRLSGATPAAKRSASGNGNPNKMETSGGTHD